MNQLYTDGGSRGNPGSSAIGYFIFDHNKLVNFGGDFIGIGTNNNAEYQALINGLILCTTCEIKTVECVLDSELVVNQLNKKYKVNSLEIKKLYDKVISISEYFDKITFKHVPRNENKFADKLVNIILDNVKK